MGLISRVSSRTYRYKNCANMVNATEVSEQVPATDTPTVEELKAKVHAEAPVEEKAADDAKPVAEVEKVEEKPVEEKAETEEKKPEDASASEKAEKTEEATPVTEEAEKQKKQL